MAAKLEPTGTGKLRSGLLALLVVAVVGAVIHFGGGSGEKPAPRDFVDDDVVEVSPLVPAARMSGASWRSAAQVREDRAAEEEQAVQGESILDQVEWGEDAQSRAYEKSVEETVKDIDGLGVYVAPADPDKKAPAGKDSAK